VKFGRLPREYDPRVPKLDTLRRVSVGPIPEAVDYSTGMPAHLGVMLNDNLGDCVEAAVGHAIQVWSFNTGSMTTPPDSAIELFYEEAGGYVPGDPNTDNGTVEQVALKDWLNTPVSGNKLAAFIEVDQQNIADIHKTIFECGLIYIGFNVPAYMPMTAGSVWDVDPSADNSIIGGHAVVVCGYDVSGNMTLISWGDRYTMTPAFWAQWVDECYALGNADWINATGHSPAGLSLTDLEALMASMRFTPSSGNRRQHRRKKRHRALV
jgi:hypothetical protein